MGNFLSGAYARLILDGSAARVAYSANSDFRHMNGEAASSATGGRA